jgi:hypothetical protein
MFIELLLFLAACGLFVYWRFHSNSNYWTKLGVRQPTINTFPLGNNLTVCPETATFAAVNHTDSSHRLYNEFKGEKYFGTYAMCIPPVPILVIRDLDLAGCILVRDFDYFVDRRFGGFDLGVGSSETDKMWNRSLMSIKGDDWRRVRSVFSPIFTPGKMKKMVHFMNVIGKLLNRDIGLAAKEGKKIDLGDLVGKYSMDVIASCAFGVEAASFSTSTPQSPFVKNSKEIFKGVSLWEGLQRAAYSLPVLHQLIELFKIPIIFPGPARFFMDSITKTIRHRIDSNFCRHDLVDLMIDALKGKLTEDNDKSSNCDKQVKKDLDESLVVASAVVMLVAGYDTTAITMSMCLWLLARHPGTGFTNISTIFLSFFYLFSIFFLNCF